MDLMTYEKSITNLQKIHSAELELLRYSDPRKTIGMEMGTLDQLKKQAVESEKNYQKRIELKMITNVIDYRNYFSEQQEQKKEIFMNLVQDEELYETFREERQEANELANEAQKKLNHKIAKAQMAINKIIQETQTDIQEELNHLKEIEMNESYLHHSEVPIRNKREVEKGLNRYIDFINSEQFDDEERIDRYIEAAKSKRNIKPVLKHVNSLNENTFRFKKYNTRKEILKGVKMNERIR